MRVRYLASFDEARAGLSEKERAQADRAVRRLLDYFEGGPRPAGLGLRQLRKPYWEVRASLDKRVVFALEKDLAVFIAIGDHDQVRRFLKR